MEARNALRFLGSAVLRTRPDVLTGRTLAGVPIERIRTGRSLRDRLSRSAREMADLERWGNGSDLVAKPKRVVLRTGLSDVGRPIPDRRRFLPRRKAAPL